MANKEELLSAAYALKWSPERDAANAELERLRVLELINRRAKRATEATDLVFLNAYEQFWFHLGSLVSFLRGELSSQTRTLAWHERHPVR